ncbi:MAG TPA: hypothetical protein VIY50_06630 [Steroidobacteraceae bacterium]
MKYVAPSSPLDIGAVLDNWLRLFRASFGSCWAIALLAAVAGALVEYTVTPRAPMAAGSSLQQYLAYLSAFRGPGVLLPDLALWLITLVIYGALLAQQAAVVRGEETSPFGDALAKGLRRLPQMLLGTLLLILIVLAICIPLGIAVAVMLVLRHSPMAVLLGSLAIVAVVIVLLYVSVRLQIWMAVMFSENRSGAASLGRSWDLVKGHWWRVTGIGFVSGIVISILSWAVGAAIGLVIGVMVVHGTTADLLLRRVQLIGAASQVARLLTMPLLTAVWFAIYQDMRLRREGGDLAARTEALSGS